MKKTTLILLALLLALTPMALAEYDYPELPQSDLPVAAALTGEWYASFQGLTVKLTFTEEGRYTLEVPGSEAQAGSWELKEDGMLYLEGSEAPLLPLTDALVWNAASLVFRREAPKTYVPAEANTRAQAETYNGWWRSHFVQIGEGTILSSAIDDDTALYIENGKAALAGKLFGRQVAEFSLSEGALTAQLDGGKLTLTLQQDGFLRLAYETGSKTEVVYLVPAADPYAKED